MSTNQRSTDALARASASFDTFDKLVVSLSGGALALSITFIGDIVDSAEPSGTGWAFFGWAMLVTSLVTSTWSHLKSARMSLQIAAQQEAKAQAIGRTVARLNAAALGALAAGLAALAMFAAMNL